MNQLEHIRKAPRLDDLSPKEKKKIVGRNTPMDMARWWRSQFWSQSDFVFVTIMSGIILLMASVLVALIPASILGMEENFLGMLGWTTVVASLTLIGWYYTQRKAITAHHEQHYRDQMQKEDRPIVYRIQADKHNGLCRVRLIAQRGIERWSLQERSYQPNDHTRAGQFVEDLEAVANELRDQEELRQEQLAEARNPQLLISTKAIELDATVQVVQEAIPVHLR